MYPSRTVHLRRFFQVVSAEAHGRLHLAILPPVGPAPKGGDDTGEHAAPPTPLYRQRVYPGEVQRTNGGPVLVERRLHPNTANGRTLKERREPMAGLSLSLIHI
eukprot:6411290-Pyramimonas_sp.AAC.2